MNVYPRLDQRVLERLIAEYRRIVRESSDPVLAVAQEVSSQVLAPGRVSHSAVGGELVSEAHLAELRTTLRALAATYGYPDQGPAERSPKWSQYDRETASTLRSSMTITPTDAGSRDVWAHMNGWLVPDLVLWRWGLAGADRGDGVARFAHGSRWFPRNQMGRLWWRCEVFGDLYTNGVLGEDQVTAIFERPSLGFNPPLARAIARCWSEHSEASGVGAEDLMRDATKRIRRLLPFVALYTLTEEELGAVVGSAFAQSKVALAGLAR